MLKAKQCTENLNVKLKNSNLAYPYHVCVYVELNGALKNPAMELRFYAWLNLYITRVHAWTSAPEYRTDELMTMYDTGRPRLSIKGDSITCERLQS